MDRSQISTFESFSSKETNEQFKLKGGGPETIEAIQDSDKQAILRHPLYPLLVMLLKKCDEATQSIEVPSLESIDSEVRMYFQQQSEDWSPMLSDSDETNDLMMMAIQILRFHLIELKKVQELCDTFCHKYITTLKHKLQADQLPPIYGVENGEDSDDDSGSGSSRSGGHLISHSPDPIISRPIPERHSKMWTNPIF
eukprot:05987.XXX_143099_142318_1 [CDS] Oithona nana genome sequencing.